MSNSDAGDDGGDGDGDNDTYYCVSEHRDHTLEYRSRVQINP